MSPEEKKERQRVAGRRYEQKRRGTRKEYMRQWRAKNAIHCKQWRSNRYQQHREEELKQNSAYCKTHAERINVNAARRYASDPERFRAKVQAWRRANPDKVKLINVALHASRKDARGAATFEQIKARVDYYGGVCAYCSEAFEHVDHVIALCLGGTGWPANLRPACKRCNLRKGRKPWRKWFTQLKGV